MIGVFQSLRRSYGHGSIALKTISPLVNIQKAMERSTIYNGYCKSTRNGYKWAIFNSYVSLPEGNMDEHPYHPFISYFDVHQQCRVSPRPIPRYTLGSKE